MTDPTENTSAHECKIKIKQWPVLAAMLGGIAILLGVLYIMGMQYCGGTYSDFTPSLIAEAPAPTLTPSIDQTTVSVGDIIQFGPYDWRVLDVQGSRALIITDRVIDYKMYHHTWEAVTWETSEIRRWLNDDFLNRFSQQEQERITTTTVVNHDNPWDFSDCCGYVSTPGGNNTIDRVFLLSIDEVLRYFGDSGMVARGAVMGVHERNDDVYHELFSWGILDHYSEARIALRLGGSARWWWLRSPGDSPRRAAIVGPDGRLILRGDSVFWVGDGDGVRPALWLHLES